MSSGYLSQNRFYVLAISVISALGGYLFGFDFAVISGALPFLREQFFLDVWQEGFLTGSLGLGCIAGCLFTGVLVDKYGRKPGLLLAAFIFALSSAGMAYATSFSFFIMMRFAAGIGVGIASMLSPMYIAEVSPAAVRGRNVAINQLTIVIGILVTNLVNYNLSGYGADAWRWMFGLGVIPSSLFFIGVLWLPESPRWLIQSGKIEKARSVLEKIGNTAFANKKIQEIESSGKNISAVRSVFEK
jgi:MFS family permease